MTVYETLTVFRKDARQSIAGVVRCTDAGWQWSADGLTFAGAADIAAQIIPLRPADYRLVAD